MDELADVPPCLLDGTFLRLAHAVLDLGEDLLDRVEIGRVWRKIPEPGSGVADRTPDRGGLVAAEIVHDDDITGFERQDEVLLDIGTEAGAVDRPIEDAGCGKPIMAQRAEEGQRAPMAMWRKPAQPLALRSPAAQRRHVGLDPGLVDEDQLVRIEARLQRAPALPPADDTSPRLLKREQRFF